MIQLFRPNISEAAIEAVSDVLRSGWIGLGPKTAEFEEAFAHYVNAPYAVAVNSATAGLHLACILAGISPGDEVITTPLTFVSTNHVILYQGATPVFADVQMPTCNIDPLSVDRLITNRTKAIICVHFGGYPCELEALRQIAYQRGIAIIEDAAHATGAVLKGNPIGSWGLTVFSFHAVKNLPVGDGGMVTTQNVADYQRLKRLRWLGIDKDTYQRTQADAGHPQAYAWQYDVPEVGYKYHMNDISAVIGLAQLPLVEEQNERRREIAAYYHANIRFSSLIYRKMALSSDTHKSAQHLYWLQVERRNDLVAKLKDNDISPGVHYIPNHLYPMYRQYKADVPRAVAASERLISLPLHTLLSDADVERVVEVINGGW